MGTDPRLMNYDEKFAKWIFREGRQYTPALLPAGMPRGFKKKCFDNCAAIALDRKFRYVEGLARDPKHPELWFLHAWLTDGIHAFDPTWIAYDREKVEIPVPSTYIGVEMAIEDVGRFMLKTKYASVFGNAYRNPDLARKCAPGLPVDRVSSLMHIELV